MLCAQMQIAIPEYVSLVPRPSGTDEVPFPIGGQSPLDHLAVAGGGVDHVAAAHVYAAMVHRFIGVGAEEEDVAPFQAVDTLDLFQLLLYE